MRVAVLALSLGAITVSSCAGSGSQPNTTVPSPTLPVTDGVIDPAVDGVFRIGVLLPETGAYAAFGRPLRTGVETAISDIAAARGVDGEAVDVVFADEGDTLSASTAGARSLIDERVDVVIGPASSLAALAVLDDFAGVDMPTCSPTATAADLSEFPDGGLFVRAIASETVEMSAIAQVVSDTGRTRVTVLAPDDEYGARLSNALADRLGAQSLGAPTTLVYEASAAPDEVAARIDDSGVIVLLGNAEDGSALLAAIAERYANTRDTPAVILSSGMRDTDVLSAMGEGAEAFIGGLRGVAPAASPNTDFADRIGELQSGGSTAYAAYAYDCVVMVALAASTASELRRDNPNASLVASMGETVRTGSPCTTYAECTALLANDTRIAYRGVSGNLDFDANGDRRTGRYTLYGFDEAGTDIDLGTPFDAS